jgi:mannose-6-phosphate isomerase-like protein (cupin superfamily)
MIKSISNAEYYTWGDHCDGWHLLNTPGLSVIQERMPAGTAEKQHFHTYSQQLFYILAGTATIEADGNVFTIGAGQSWHIVKGSVHQISNLALVPLDFLVISEPHAHGDRTNI